MALELMNRENPSQPVTGNVSETVFRGTLKKRLRILNRALCEIHGINKAQIADRLGVVPSTVTNWESERTLKIPDQYRLFLYVEKFHVSLNWLYTGDLSRMHHDLAKAIERHSTQD